MEAILILQGNIHDCLYGTTYALDAASLTNGRDLPGNFLFWNSRNTNYTATEHVDRSGTSREDDGSGASMQAIVQQTLYCFDRLLYAKLAS